MSVRDDSEGPNGNLERWSYRVREDGRVVDVRKVTFTIGAGGLIDPQPTFENDVDELWIPGDSTKGTNT